VRAKERLVSVYETSSEWESPELEFGTTGEAGGTGEVGESETEGFLGGVLGSVLGGEVGEAEAPMSETQELELASELLEVTSEAELEQFLGNVFKKVASGVGSFMKSSTGKALGGILKGVAKKILPVAAGALGNLVAPGVGGAIGSRLGSMATKLFEVELEGMNEQEAEFEVARRYVRLASSAARHATLAPRGAPSRAVARAAVVAAARRHAPGLLRGTPYQVPRGSGYGGPGGGPRRPRPRPYGYGYPPDGGAYGYGGYGYQPNGGNGGGYGGGYGDEPWGDQDDGGGWGELGGGGALAGQPHGARSGRWIRRGRKIVILGA
jgi:uncharacterized protein (DUF697 family)